MIFFKNIICFVILSFGVILPQIGFSAPSQKGQKYISKDEVDTSIQRGFILLNESADMAGVGFRHERSIAEAKKIVKRLKEAAKGDPNERYVLWKAGELEAQIYLEESDLVLQRMRQRQITINELVDKYNAEVGKWRPDFATLYRIYRNMEQTDAGKANELADSFNKRKRALSREVVYFLEKTLLVGNADSARKELGYLLRNQLYLDVSKSEYRRLEERVEKLMEAVDAKPQIESKAASAARLLDKRDISGARLTLDTANNIFTTVKPYLPQREIISLTSLLNSVKARLNELEDSLVQVNIAIFRSRGPGEADKYIRKVLRPCGVSHQKIAFVDRMIIDAGSSEIAASSPSGIYEPVYYEEGKEEALDNVMAAAKKKAQERMDSLQAIENERLKREEVERKRLDSLERAAAAGREAALRLKRQRADSVAMAVYTLIEKNDPGGAKKLFEKEKEFLRKYQPGDEYTMLITTLQYFTNETVEKSQVAYITPVEDKSKVNLQSKPDDSELHANLERAQDEIRGIYTMLEQNDIARAYRRFQVNKQPLQKYLTAEAFNMLQLSVEQAYADYSARK